MELKINLKSLSCRRLKTITQIKLRLSYGQPSNIKHFFQKVNICELVNGSYA